MRSIEQLESLEFVRKANIQAAWVNEAKRRRHEVRSGSIQPISGDEALAQLRQMLEQ